MIKVLNKLKSYLGIKNSIDQKSLARIQITTVLLAFFQLISIVILSINSFYLSISLTLNLILISMCFIASNNLLKHSFKNVGSEIEMIAGGTQNLVMAGQQMQSFANESSERTQTVVTMTAGFNDKIHSIASATSQMNLSVKEIAQHSNQVLSTANNAVELAQETRSYIQKLSENNTDIGKIVELINSIAEQTNLLALNATIESARAGDAGKGFAVVASEVKELAKETANATQDIREKVSTIQGNTEKSVALIESIDNIIGQLNDYQNMIATAIDEQVATTREISRNLEEVNTESLLISDNIQELNSISENNINCVEESLMASEMLGAMCLELKSTLE